jgi:hypothetical protein
MNYCTPMDDRHHSRQPRDLYASVVLATIAVESGNRILMAKKKKLKRFRAVTAVKELARERVGAPPAEKIVIEKTKKPEKYRPTLEKLLEPE